MPETGLSIGDALREAAALIGRVDARVLLAHVLDRPVSYLIAHPEQRLDGAQTGRWDDLVQRRRHGEPVAYLVGEREFYGRAFHVDARVLIPRPETELIIDLALAEWPQPPRRVLDLGTGSGALAVTLALEWTGTEVWAVDASEGALAVAQQNATRLGAPVTFVASSWFDGMTDAAPFDLIVSNPPYVRAGDPHLSQGDVRFEPPSALAAGEDGLDDIRRILDGAPNFLRPHGRILFEHGYDQASDVRRLLHSAGFSNVRSWRDLADIERVTGGRLDATPAPP
jgi:release factor glutamine methyltransferase